MPDMDDAMESDVSVVELRYEVRGGSGQHGLATRADARQRT